MSAFVPIKLILGFLLLNILQSVAPVQSAAQTPTLKLTTGVSSVRDVATTEPTFPIAQQSPRPRRIQFRPRTSSAVVENSVVRGTRDTYLLGARAGQTMTVSISSLENNAVFDIVAPNGETLQQEMTSASLILPSTGDYKAIVSGTRGNATYTLRVEIK